MEQLLIHLFSDYWLQNDWMALNKKNGFRIACIHSIVYTIPFLLLTRSILAMFVIFITHAIIDGTNIVNKLNQIKNWDFKQDNWTWLCSDRPLKQQMIPVKDGYTGRPTFIRVWLLIIQDNILHLIINYLSIKYL